MPTNVEKTAFSKRLELALRRSEGMVVGATELANRFNLRYKEGTPVSTQTAHKWLSGRAIPTHAKLATLAKWLNVDEHWLHYGPVPSKEEGKKAVAASADAIKLAQKIQSLPPHKRYLVEELVNQLQDNL
ncbi:transcriptional regulator [Herbaspirillum sp. RV1423]|uniref:transcriptional regulator n=1 Tax=Herbaspirillum sp. RV1423 TaxID=1443993 RepID=UPI0004AFF93E|nr:transcriptional regulator [Herbaspirillum sp. RV1423]